MNAAGRDFRTLSRIAALLTALALVAERAGGMAFPIRFIVLAILRRAETVAHGCVLDETQANWPYFDEDLEMDNRPLDAAWRAWRFRLLASMLGALMRLASGADTWQACMRDAAYGVVSRPVLTTFAGWIRVAIDTS